MRIVLFFICTVLSTSLSGASFQAQLSYRHSHSSQSTFTWSWELGCGPAFQEAYQIQIFRQYDQQCIWDSKRISSPLLRHTADEEIPLRPHTTYSWRIRVWDKEGEGTEWSEPSTIQTQLEGNTSWQRQDWISYAAYDSSPVKLPNSYWIGSGEGEKDTLFFRRRFKLDTKMAEGLGTAYLAANTLHWVWINGKRIGGAREANRLYNLYIRQHLKKGENEIQVGLLPSPRKAIGFVAQIDLTDENFRSQQLVSDSSWRRQNGSPARLLSRYGDGRHPVFRPRVLPAKALFLSKTYTLPEGVVAAHIYATGLGLYELEANGEAVAKDHFSPGWTDYRHRIAYQQYDLTRFLDQDSLHLGVWLGSGWWRGGLGWREQKVYSEGPLRFKAQIWLTMENGQQIGWRTDTSWQARLSPIIYQSLYRGEGYDARIDLEQAPRFPVSILAADTSVKLSPMIEPPIKVAEQIPMMRLADMPDRIRRYDAGRVLSGRVRLSVRAARGTRLVLRFAEERDSQGKLLIAANRSARNTDIYICRGDTIEQWAPRFSYRGFRHVDVQIDGKLDSLQLRAEILRNQVEELGQFYCGDTLLNQIWELVGRSIEGNTFSVPTDCPQRDERLGWLADGWLSAETAMRRYDMRDFYRKWLQDIRDGQDSSGYVLDVHPPMVIRDEAAKPGWGDAIVLLPWALFHQTGDSSFLQENYGAMRLWTDYRLKQARDSLYQYRNGRGFAGFGDWQALEGTDPDFVAGAMHIITLRIMEKVATILQDTHSQSTYFHHRLHQTYLFGNRYWNADTGYWGKGSQTAQALGLFATYTYPSFPTKSDSAALQYLLHSIQQQDYHLSSGFLGQWAICSLLSMPKVKIFAGEDVMANIIHQTSFPGLGYMLTHGATTLWENWDHDQRGPLVHSSQHMAFSAPGQWIYDIGGIAAPIAGFREFTLKPDWKGAGDTLHLQYKGPRGTIGIQWARRPKGGIFRFRIPPNSSAIFSPWQCQLTHGQLKMYAAEEVIFEESDLSTAKDRSHRLNPGSYQVIWEH